MVYNTKRHELSRLVHLTAANNLSIWSFTTVRAENIGRHDVLQLGVGRLTSP